MRRVHPVRLLIASCSVDYSGRLSTHLPEAVRLLMIKPDGGVSVWLDGGSSVKPQNCGKPADFCPMRIG
jgi:RecB family endonuclease NucS